MSTIISVPVVFLFCLTYIICKSYTAKGYYKASKRMYTKLYSDEFMNVQNFEQIENLMRNEDFVKRNLENYTAAMHKAIQNRLFSVNVIKKWLGAGLNRKCAPKLKKNMENLLVAMESFETKLLFIRRLIEEHPLYQQHLTNLNFSMSMGKIAAAIAGIGIFFERFYSYYCYNEPRVIFIK